MHNYNVGNRFTTKTKLGNWYEEKELDDHQFKEYLYQKANNNNLTLNTTAKLGFSNQQVTSTRLSSNSPPKEKDSDTEIVFNSKMQRH